MLYQIIRLYAKLLIKLHYQMISVVGKEHIPTKGPLLVYSNHPNALGDPLIILDTLDRDITFTATSTLGKFKIIRKTLMYFNFQLIHRKMDGHSKDTMRRNEETLQSCADLLAEGKTILLFPEGRSYTGQKMVEFKTGISRIIHKYYHQTDYNEKLQVLPVYLEYQNKSVFRSSVTVHIFPAESHHEWYQQHTELTRESLKQKTNELRETLTMEENATIEELTFTKRKKMLLYAILSAFSLIFSLIPAIMIHLISHRYSKRDDQYTTFRIGLAFLFLPIAYVFIIGLLIQYFSLLVVLYLTLLSFPSHLFSIKLFNRKPRIQRI
ncbi:MAG: 1-acyl-sn-glycerol-3-phosphate acyltransferase [Candidatus Heimdallarchaeota archaeon]|nr:1-acyl-sn-glycerol-3-phosphate acyltransferase [Candidatus Heimdallarchaeota archaeon]